MIVAGDGGGLRDQPAKNMFASGTVVMYDATTLNAGGKKNDQ
jgi:hypothetical protein